MFTPPLLVLLLNSPGKLSFLTPWPQVWNYLLPATTQPTVHTIYFPVVAKNQIPDSLICCYIKNHCSRALGWLGVALLSQAVCCSSVVGSYFRTCYCFLFLLVLPSSLLVSLVFIINLFSSNPLSTYLDPTYPFPPSLSTYLCQLISIQMVSINLDLSFHLYQLISFVVSPSLYQKVAGLTRRSRPGASCLSLDWLTVASARLAPLGSAALCGRRSASMIFWAGLMLLPCAWPLCALARQAQHCLPVCRHAVAFARRLWRVAGASCFLLLPPICIWASRGRCGAVRLSRLGSAAVWCGG